MFTINVELFDGRRLLYSGKPVLVHVRDSAGRNLISRFIDSHSFSLNVELDPNPAANHLAVVVAASGHLDAGFFPISATEGGVANIHLMMVHRDRSPSFHPNAWQALQQSGYSQLLASTPQAGQSFKTLLQSETDRGFCLLNILTAIGALPQASAIQPLLKTVELRKRIGNEWAGLQRDRVFLRADPQLESELMGSPHFAAADASQHKPANTSYKEIRFGEANLQFSMITDEATLKARGVPSGQIEVDIDMDYFDDKAAHVMLEVIPNTVGGFLGKIFGFGSLQTDPRRIYALRWMAARNADPPEDFSPLYSLSEG